VSVATQRVPLNALIFLYREILGAPPDELHNAPARKRKQLPVVFSPEEATGAVATLEGEHPLPAMLTYRAGLRISETLRLRVKDVDFGMQQLIVREGKGGKDRITLLPERLIEPLQKQIHSTLLQHQVDMGPRL